jgi:ribonuclease HI
MARQSETTWTAFFDGSSCAGQCGIGFLIRDPHGFVVCEISMGLDQGDALTAEYRALIGVLGKLKSLNVDRAVICGDSRTVVHQVNGQVRTRATNRFLDIILKARSVLADHPKWIVKWVPRNQNGRADLLASEGLYKVRRKKKKRWL